jgi:acyl carrier protein
MPDNHRRKKPMTTTSAQKTDIAPAVRALIADYTKLPLEQITPDRALDDLGLDSLGGLELILTCEAEFGIVALDDNGIEVHTVGDAIAFIQAKL